MRCCCKWSMQEATTTFALSAFGEAVKHLGSCTENEVGRVNKGQSVHSN